MCAGCGRVECGRGKRGVGGVRMCMLCAFTQLRTIRSIRTVTCDPARMWGVGGLMAYGAVREPRRTRRREVEVNSEGA